MPSNWKNREKRVSIRRGHKLTKRIMTDGRNSKANSKAVTKQNRRRQKEIDEEFYC